MVEPFVGAGAIFLNTEYKRYLLNDINPDLINLYKTIQQAGLDFIDYAEKFFHLKNNNAERFYHYRERFNNSRNICERSALFLYLNRHCYNGLCRYNAKGEFNVPFGTYKKPYFPRHELIEFQKKSKHARFTCFDFQKIFKQCRKGNIVYCDPPYVPLSATANFTGYSQTKFSPQDQHTLAKLAIQHAKKGVIIIISNHDTDITRQLYQKAQLISFPVKRYISCNGNKRLIVPELLALFD